jgi:hypothetical protein
MGYNKRDRCVQFLADNKRNWNHVKIIAFDAPQATDKPYIQRLELLQKSKL